MTDLRHVAQLLHEAGVSEGLGPTALATWLGRRIHDVERDGDNEERARRLESDADAVQVITIHRSKGLEFPIVYCPFAWDGYAKRRDVPMFHDPANANKRTIDVGHEGNDFARHQKMEIEEGRGEDLRLLYVALTRARHQAVLWWAGASDSQHSPLARLLFDRDPSGVVPPYGAAARSDAAVEAAGRRSGRGWRWSGSVRLRPHSGIPQAEPAPVLEAARFARPLDTEWRPGVLLEHHPRRARAARHRERARTRARADLRRRGRRAAGPARRPGGGGRRRRPDAVDRPRAGRHARRRAGRHGRAQRLRAHGLRRARPGGRGPRRARPAR